MTQVIGHCVYNLDVRTWLPSSVVTIPLTRLWAKQPQRVTIFGWKGEIGQFRAGFRTQRKCFFIEVILERNLPYFSQTGWKFIRSRNATRWNYFYALPFYGMHEEFDYYCWSDFLLNCGCFHAVWSICKPTMWICKCLCSQITPNLERFMKWQIARMVLFTVCVRSKQSVLKKDFCRIL